MGECILHFYCQVIDTTQIKEHQLFRSEIVQNSRGARCNHWFRLRQIFENARRHIEFREGAAPIWNHPDIAFGNRTGDLLELHGTHITNRFGEVGSLNGTHAILEERRVPTRFTIPEKPFVRAVHDHANLVGWTGSAQKELADRLICRQDGIGKSDAPSFEYFEKSDWVALLRKPEDSHHQLRHRIMKIEDHLSAKEFWDQRAEDQDVRHVVNMNKVIPALERSSC